MRRQILFPSCGVGFPAVGLGLAGVSAWMRFARELLEEAQRRWNGVWADQTRLTITIATGHRRGWRCVGLCRAWRCRHRCSSLESECWTSCAEF